MAEIAPAAADVETLLTSPPITVSIGRNIGTDPMSTLAWSHFQLRTHDLLAEHADILSQTVGHSVWTGDDGATTSEDSYSVVAQPHSAVDVVEIRIGLGCLATTYAQDAIALTVAAAEFIPPSN